jgi:hypothetical protein
VAEGQSGELLLPGEENRSGNASMRMRATRRLDHPRQPSLDAIKIEHASGGTSIIG